MRTRAALFVTAIGAVLLSAGAARAAVVNQVESRAPGQYGQAWWWVTGMPGGQEGLDGRASSSRAGWLPAAPSSGAAARSGSKPSRRAVRGSRSSLWARSLFRDPGPDGLPWRLRADAAYSAGLRRAASAKRRPGGPGAGSSAGLPGSGGASGPPVVVGPGGAGGALPPGGEGAYDPDLIPGVGGEGSQPLPGEGGEGAGQGPDGADHLPPPDVGGLADGDEDPAPGTEFEPGAEDPGLVIEPEPETDLTGVPFDDLPLLPDPVEEGAGQGVAGMEDLPLTDMPLPDAQLPPTGAPETAGGPVQAVAVPTAVPEPGSLALVALGLAAVPWARRRRPPA